MCPLSTNARPSNPRTHASSPSNTSRQSHARDSINFSSSWTMHQQPCEHGGRVCKVRWWGIPRTCRWRKRSVWVRWRFFMVYLVCAPHPFPLTIFMWLMGWVHSRVPQLNNLSTMKETHICLCWLICDSTLLQSMVWGERRTGNYQVNKWQSSPGGNTPSANAFLIPSPHSLWLPPLKIIHRSGTSICILIIQNLIPLSILSWLNCQTRSLTSNISIHATSSIGT